MTLPTVASAGHPVCGCFREGFQTDVVCLFCLARQWFPDRGRLARANLLRGLGLLQHTVVRLHANVGQCQQGVRLHGPRVLRGRYVRACPMRDVGRLFHLLRFFFFRGHVSDGVGTNVVRVNVFCRYFGVFREICDHYANARFKYASVCNIHPVVCNFGSTLRIFYKDRGFCLALLCRSVSLVLWNIS